MRKLSTLFFVTFIFISSTISQSVGDYRSNVSTGAWEAATSWQVFDGSIWISATEAPSSTDGLITIVAGDSIRLNASRTIDQVIIEEDAILSIFNLSGATTFTLNDEDDHDIIVNGKLYIASNATLAGTGSIGITSTGQLILRNSGILSVDTENNGTTYFTNNVWIRNSAFLNRGTVNWESSNINLEVAFIINESLININVPGSSFLQVTTLGALSNSATGIIEKRNHGGVTTIAQLNNSGIIKGVGEINAQPNAGNTGIISPGNTPNNSGILTINPSALHNRSPEIIIEINSAGAIPGVNHDKLNISNRPTNHNPVSLSASTLTVTGDPGDPAGTTYTILESVASPSGNLIPLTGQFLVVNKPEEYSITYNTYSVVLTREGILPLTWGSFTLGQNDGNIMLNWATLHESKTSHFTIEYTTDSKNYIAVGSLPANGNTTGTSNYSFSYSPKPGENSFHFRILQVDLDGRSSYSETRAIRLAIGTQVQIYPNPVQSTLNINFLSHNSKVVIHDLSGRIVNAKRFANKGTQQIDLSNLPTGVYQVSVYDKDLFIFTSRIFKQ